MKVDMRNILGKAQRVAIKTKTIVKDDGVVGFTKRATQYAYYRKYPDKKKKEYKDILFINGCALPHPARYRVSHQMEQLLSNGLSSDSVFYEQLTLDMLRYYRGFVFFRCPITDTVREFIKTAHTFNKTCFFDIDDLVIDTKYTNQIKYVQQMPEADRSLYDDGVNRMRETLMMCDYAITTTTQLQQELKKYIGGEVLINRNVASDEMVHLSNKALETVAKDENKVVVGYFSGSITHNENFDLVMPSIVKLLRKYPNLFIKVVGILDIPDDLIPYRDRIINIKFTDWKKLPREITSCDINIAPLVDTIFNRAKSENKWVEAALVKVPTVASRVGAFRESIKNEVTGILADDNEWFEVLDKIIKDADLRLKIGLQSNAVVLRSYNTVYTGKRLADFINSKLARNIGFVLPSTDISGGVTVALKHADILRRKGWDVTIIDDVSTQALKIANKTYRYRHELEGFNVVAAHKTDFSAYFDTHVATLWATLDTVKSFSNTRNKLYFVQSFETDFYSAGTGEARFLANASYSDMSGVRYITMSLWCRAWLKDKFRVESKYVSNGIDIENYTFRKRNFSGKIKILIEGDSKSKYKNTDEAFRIVDKLDPSKYEISYLSYRKDPKDWYHVDHFYNRIAPEKVGEVYGSCDILIKTSLLESFSYPPLEMMATGGVSVVVPNEGNIEYLKDGENCLFYKQGDIDSGVAAVERLINDTSLREKIIKNGRRTAEAYKWTALEDDVAAIYK